MLYIVLSLPCTYIQYMPRSGKHRPPTYIHVMYVLYLGLMWLVMGFKLCHHTQEIEKRVKSLQYNPLDSVIESVYAPGNMYAHIIHQSQVRACCRCIENPDRRANRYTAHKTGRFSPSPFEPNVKSFSFGFLIHFRRDLVQLKIIISQIPKFIDELPFLFA